MRRTIASTIANAMSALMKVLISPPQIAYDGGVGAKAPAPARYRMCFGWCLRSSVFSIALAVKWTMSPAITSRAICFMSSNLTTSSPLDMNNIPIAL
nr:MAG TPA: hypothetical protein [Caudoviricetes sp.]